MPSVGRPAHSPLLVPLAVVVMSVAVHWRALFMFFSADDLVHLQQATGLMPTPSVPWRVLTQVGYFRLMLWLVGPWPAAFMLVNLGLHGLNTALLLDYFTRRGVPRATAALATVLFGACPLLSVVLGHAVIINDLSALTFCLLALRWFARGGRSGQVLGALAFVVALLCKESVLFLPLLAVVPAAGESARVRFRELSLALVIMVVASIAFFVARLHLAAPSGWAYAFSLWPAPFHNLMTYTRWFVSLHRALPDLVRSPDPSAWRVALPVLLGLSVAAAWSRRDAQAVRLGLAWWILGLLPVLPLSHSTYPHYLYVALPGIALAVASAVSGIASRFVGERVDAPVAADTAVAPGRRWTAIATLIALLYAARAEALVSERFTLRLQGIDIPLDPQIRSMVIAGRAVYSLATTPPPPHTRLAILSPEGHGRVFGARTGREYVLPDSVSAGYDMQRVILSDGRALRVFFPQLDSVVYVTHWSRGLAGFAAATRSAGGEIEYYGPDLSDHLRLVRDMAAAGRGAEAVQHADSLRTTFAEAPALEALADSIATSIVPRMRR